MSDGPVFVERIDYKAAAREIGMVVRGVQKFGIRNKHEKVDSELEGHWAGRIVGAALVGVKEANGQRVEWCEEHGVPQQTTYVDDFKGEYECAEAPYSEKPCRIVSKLLIDPTTEEV